MKASVAKEAELRSVCDSRGNREPRNASKTESDRSEHVLRTATVLARDWDSEAQDKQEAL